MISAVASAVVDSTSPDPSEIISWAQVLVGAPVAVTVLLFALTAWRLLDKGRLVLGREHDRVVEALEKSQEENDSLRSQLTAYRDRVEADMLPALIRTTDLVSRIVHREEERR